MQSSSLPSKDQARTSLRHQGTQRGPCLRTLDTKKRSLGPERRPSGGHQCLWRARTKTFPRSGQATTQWRGPGVAAAWEAPRCPGLAQGVIMKPQRALRAAVTFISQSTPAPGRREGPSLSDGPQALLTWGAPTGHLCQGLPLGLTRWAGQWPWERRGWQNRAAGPPGLPDTQDYPNQQQNRA